MAYNWYQHKNINKKKFDSFQKANFHSARGNSSSKNKADFKKINYSAAFTHGDQMGWLPKGHDGLLRESRSYSTKYQKQAYWRGVNNRHKREF